MIESYFSDESSFASGYTLHYQYVWNSNDYMVRLVRRAINFNKLTKIKWCPAYGVEHHALNLSDAQLLNFKDLHHALHQMRREITSDIWQETEYSIVAWLHMNGRPRFDTCAHRCPEEYRF